jgi:hypothetical protein
MYEEREYDRTMPIVMSNDTDKKSALSVIKLLVKNWVI